MIHGFPEKPVWVGQQVPFYTTLLMPERPRGSPLFHVPDVAGGILLHVAGRPVYGSEEIDGVEFMSWVYSFAYYAQKAGEHVIPSITARVKLPQGDGTFRQHTVRTEAFSLTADLPQGAEGLATLVATPQLDVHEKWEIPDADLRVGDSVARVITMKAKDILGLGFPSLEFVKQEGLALYPNPPKVKDETYRGDITGKRIESVVYVFEKEGQYTVPGLIIPWFDLKTNELKKVSLPSKRFRVATNPAFVKPEESQVDSPVISWQVVGFVILGIAALSAVALFFSKRFRPQLNTWIGSRIEKRRSGETYLYRQLKAAVRSKNIVEIINRATLWLQGLGGEDQAKTLSTFAECYGEPAFKNSVYILMERHYGSGAGTGKWDDWEFINRLASARKRALKIKKHPPNPLPSLNPSRQKHVK